MNHKTDIKTLDLPEDSLILVGDDPNKNLEIVFNILSNIGFDVITNNNGQTAIKQVESRSPDLILLDVMMPHQDRVQSSSLSFLFENNSKNNSPSR